ncbi:hypothetical protein FNV68_49200 [Streptomyces sp. S1D4-23]|nr:hypothetical protein FNV61_48130 [Streptomyces sp. RLB3-6]QDO13075.1 hypothetical protein FNV68_49200 [Streptomyces sp. S1D4-23]
MSGCWLISRVGTWCCVLATSRLTVRSSNSCPENDRCGISCPKNGWTLAEDAGHAGSDRIHRRPNRIEWDAGDACVTGRLSPGRHRSS